MYDIESMKRQEEERNKFSEQLKKRFLLDEYYGHMKKKLTLVRIFKKVTDHSFISAY